jgi:DNA-binding transcriptional LysR family regulator
MTYRQPTSAPTLRLTNRVGETRDLRQAGPLSSDNGDMLLAAAREGLGYLIQPDFLVADDVRSGRLVRVLPDWHGPDAAMWVVYPHRSLLSARVRAFVDFLLERLREPEWCLGAG